MVEHKIISVGADKRGRHYDLAEALKELEQDGWEVRAPLTIGGRTVELILIRDE